jgi:hypothetical protein
MSNFNKFTRVVRWPSIILWIFIWFLRAFSEIKFTGFIDKIINSTNYNIPVDITTIILLPLAMGGVFLYASEPNEKPKKGSDLFRNIWEKDKFYFLFTTISVVGSITYGFICNLS